MNIIEKRPKVFVLASDEVMKDCYERAQAWYNEPNQKMFKDVQSIARSAIAEFIANEQGFTLFELSATYPKSAKL